MGWSVIIYDNSLDAHHQNKIFQNSFVHNFSPMGQRVDGSIFHDELIRSFEIVWYLLLQGSSKKEMTKEECLFI